MLWLLVVACTWNVTTPQPEVAPVAAEPAEGPPEQVVVKAARGSRWVFKVVPCGETTGIYSSLVLGSDRLLYAAQLDGNIARFTLGERGELSPLSALETVPRARGRRLIIGMAFHPLTGDLWISHSAPYLGPGSEPAPDWTGRIARLVAPDFTEMVDVVVGLPRSANDHATNSLRFREEEGRQVLYFTQGSNSSTGAADPVWFMREEAVLSAAVLRLQLDALGEQALDVSTHGETPYDPFAPGAPLTLYATGIRNAYDLLWHDNGSLYTAVNGSAKGGNVAATPAALPASCERRADSTQHGAYTGPAVPALQLLLMDQDDFFVRVRPGGYYGHPNPSRCEWVLAGGNPTRKRDLLQVKAYPVGTQPDRSWRGDEMLNVGAHASANGLILYRNEQAFGGRLAGKILLTRFANPEDIVVVILNEEGDPSEILPIGLTSGDGRLNKPLDLVEDPTTGILYVTELNQRKMKGRIRALIPADL